MTEELHLTPRQERAMALSRRFGRWLLRVASIGAGAAIEYKQVTGPAQAQWSLIFLGLWFIGVPPALWFDGVWRLAKIASAVQSLEQAGPSAPQDHREPTKAPSTKGRRR